MSYFDSSEISRDRESRVKKLNRRLLEILCSIDEYPSNSSLYASAIPVLPFLFTISSFSTSPELDRNPMAIKGRWSWNRLKTPLFNCTATLDVACAAVFSLPP